MDKPIIILREELVNKLAADIKESGVPAFIMRPIIEDILNQVRVAERNEFQFAFDAYNKAIQDENQPHNAEAEVEPIEPTDSAGDR